MFARNPLMQVLLWLAMAHACHAQSAPDKAASATTLWTDAVLTPASAPKSISSTAISNKFSILLSDGSISLQTPADPLSSRFSSNISLSFNDGIRPASFESTFDFRFFVKKPKGARVTVLLIVDDKIRVLKYADSQSLDGNHMARVVNNIHKTNSVVRVAFEVLVDRPTVDTPVLVSLDSVDIATSKAVWADSRESKQ